MLSRMESFHWTDVSNVLLGDKASGNIASEVLPQISSLDEAHLIYHDLCTNKLIHLNWDTRISTSRALKNLTTRYSMHLSDLLRQAVSDGDLFYLGDIDVPSLLESGTKLYSDDALFHNLEDLYEPKWVARQRKELRTRLGKEAPNKDSTVAVKYSDIEEFVKDEDILSQNRSLLHSKESLPHTSFTEEEHSMDSPKEFPLVESTENWFVRLIRYMAVGLLDPKWETRHGCSLGLMSIIQALSVTTDNSPSSPPLNNTTSIPSTQSSTSSFLSSSSQSFLPAYFPSFLIEDIVCSCIYVIVLDRLIDMSFSTISIAPVKETAAQLLAICSQMSYLQGMNNHHFPLEIFTCCLRMMQSEGGEKAKESSWVLQLGGFLALKYQIPVQPSSVILEHVPRLLHTAVASLVSPIDDLVTVSAQFLHSLLLTLSRSQENLHTIGTYLLPHLPEICSQVIVAASNANMSSGFLTDLCTLLCTVSRYLSTVTDALQEATSRLSFLPTQQHHTIHSATASIVQTVSAVLEAVGAVLAAFRTIISTSDIRKRLFRDASECFRILQQILTNLVPSHFSGDLSNLVPSHFSGDLSNLVPSHFSGDLSNLVPSHFSGDLSNRDLQDCATSRSSDSPALISFALAAVSCFCETFHYMGIICDYDDIRRMTPVLSTAHPVVNLESSQKTVGSEESTNIYPTVLNLFHAITDFLKSLSKVPMDTCTSSLDVIGEVGGAILISLVSWMTSRTVGEEERGTQGMSFPDSCGDLVEGLGSGRAQGRGQGKRTRKKGTSSGGCPLSIINSHMGIPVVDEDSAIPDKEDLSLRDKFRVICYRIFEISETTTKAPIELTAFDSLLDVMRIFVENVLYDENVRCFQHIQELLNLIISRLRVCTDQISTDSATQMNTHTAPKRASFVIVIGDRSVFHTGSRETAVTVEQVRLLENLLKVSIVIISTIKNKTTSLHATPPENTQKIVDEFSEMLFKIVLSLPKEFLEKQRYLLNIFENVHMGNLEGLLSLAVEEGGRSRWDHSSSPHNPARWGYIPLLVAQNLCKRLRYDPNSSHNHSGDSTQQSRLGLIPRELLTGISDSTKGLYIRAVVKELASLLKEDFFFFFCPISDYFRMPYTQNNSVNLFSCEVTIQLLSVYILGSSDAFIHSSVQMLQSSEKHDTIELMVQVAVDALCSSEHGLKSVVFDDCVRLLLLSSRYYTNHGRNAIIEHNLDEDILGVIINFLQRKFTNPKSVSSERQKCVVMNLCQRLSDELGAELTRTNAFVGFLSIGLSGLADYNADARALSSKMLRSLIPMITLAKGIDYLKCPSLCIRTGSIAQSLNTNPSTRAIYHTLFSGKSPSLGEDPADRTILTKLFEYTGISPPEPAETDFKADEAAESGSSGTSYSLKLRPYQWQGISWLTTLRRCGFGALLADEMGLGKTIQALVTIAIQALELNESGVGVCKCLVVCPSSLVTHWKNEVKRFFPNNFMSIAEFTNSPRSDMTEKVLPAMSSTKKRRYIISSESPLADQPQFPIQQSTMPPVLCEIVIISFHNLRARPSSIVQPFWQAAIIDESHCCGNPQSQLSICVRDLKAGTRIALSGTPIQNDVEEIWSVMRFLMPDYLGDYKSFRNDYVLPIKRSFKKRTQMQEIERKNQQLITKDKSNEDKNPLFSALEIAAEGLSKLRDIHHQVLPFILRRTKDLVLNEVPPKIITDIFCPLSDTQRNLYQKFQSGQGLDDDSLERDLSSIMGQSDGREKQSGKALQALLYLQLLSVHPVLVLDSQYSAYCHRLLQDISSSGKMKALAKVLLERTVIHRHEIEELMFHKLYIEEEGYVTRANNNNDDMEADEDVEQDECDTQGSGDNNNDEKKKGEKESKPNKRKREKSAKFNSRIRTKNVILEKINSKRSRNRTAVNTPSRESSEINSKANVVEIGKPRIQIRKCLIFARHRVSLDIIESCVMKCYFPTIQYGRIDGSTPVSRRSELIREFNEERGTNSIRILLLTTLSCGLGLNLIGADTVIFVEHSWNPFHDFQAADRAHRIGQRDSVVIFRLLAESTIEQRIIGLQGRKVNIAEEVIDSRNMFQMHQTSHGGNDSEDPSLGSALLTSLVGKIDHRESSSTNSIDDDHSKNPFIDYDSLNLERFLASIGSSSS